MGGQLRGRRVIIGLPGHGWRGDLRADEKVVQGSRTYVPVMSEGEWYRAEAEQTEVFAPLVPVERVWVEEYGMAGVIESIYQPFSLFCVEVMLWQRQRTESLDEAYERLEREAAAHR